MGKILEMIIMGGVYTLLAIGSVLWWSILVAGPWYVPVDSKPMLILVKAFISGLMALIYLLFITGKFFKGEQL